MICNTYKNVDKHNICNKNCPKPSNVQNNLVSWDPTKELPLFITGPELIKVFRRFDVNGDGRLSRQELKNAFKSLGARFPAYRAFMASRQADKNGDGYVSDDEMDELIRYASSCGYYVH